jgi:hypothetical protein
MMSNAERDRLKNEFHTGPVFFQNCLHDVRVGFRKNRVIVNVADDSLRKTFE